MTFGFCWRLAEGLHRHQSLSQLLCSAHARATGLCPGVRVADHQPPPLEPRQNFHPLLRMIEEWVKDISPKQCVRYPVSLAQLMYFLQKLYFRSSGCTFFVCPEPTIFYSTDFSEITFLESKEKKCSPVLLARVGNNFIIQNIWEKLVFVAFTKKTL